MKDDSIFYIFGRNAILEALKSDENIEKIYYSFGLQGRQIDQIVFLARKAKVPVTQYDKQKFSALANNLFGDSAKTQGVIAQKSIVNYIDIDDLIEDALGKEENPVILMLDEINDPGNLGAIARTAECSGVAGIILPERNSSPVTPAAVKSSAGAINHLKLCKTVNMIQAIKKLKDSGFWITGTALSARQLYTAPIYDRPTVIVIGNEGKGMKPSLQKHCDNLVKIPILGKIDSLNASVSCGIILYEIVRQRQK
ncbi:MAG: 23S rRNA (guanosine(2251)-2'-O)-methyltransferase RlmB [Candidatus Kapabacteria bacterium]|nr:23S rRNA (guanosine(2251)-2'-O)-methyltransferase RlmB [Ignavibacteriota bacterium]MCW5884276.1 23S rRNA (guanosine(2251)-2'-O)-methyltransferase RlmB [Candidatus Kapabacteria bacterium]